MPKGKWSFDRIRVNGKEYVSVGVLLKEIASIVNFSENYVRQLARNQEIPGIKHKERWYFNVQAVKDSLTFGVQYQNGENGSNGQHLGSDVIPESNESSKVCDWL